METLTLQVEGMSCNHCKQSVEKALGEIGAQGQVDLAQKSVVVTYDSAKLTLAQIKDAIEDQGYDVL